MTRGHGKTQSERITLDPERELPQPEAAAKDESPQEFERVKQERDELHDRLARQQAEFENFRKRSQREQTDFKQYAVTETIKSLLPTLDSFERALQSHPEPSEFRSGVELIYRQLRDALMRLGVTEIEAQGRPFDPRVHEAVEMVPVQTGEAEDHHVLEVLQRGYMLKDRLLRPAMVRVAKRS